MMKSSSHVAAPRWSIILAGGEGERTRPFIEQCLGQYRPKQYCSFVGTRSMLQHTWDRADCLTAPENKLTVVSQAHHEMAWSQLEKHSSGKMVFQPWNRDTAAGIFLPLTYVQTWCPEATVVFFPSDHFVYPEAPFLETVRRAVGAAERFTDRLILLGIAPATLELEYGWIEPEWTLAWSGGSPVRRVRTFLEKPSPPQAVSTLQRGALWNTLVFAVKGDTLWNLGKDFFPDVIERFEALTQVIGTAKEGCFLNEIYQDMPQHNFSADLLARVPDRVGVIELRDVLWSDWGHPHRIVQTLREIRKGPAVPFEGLHSFIDSPVVSRQNLSEVSL